MDNKIGALWRKFDKNNREYQSGTVEINKQVFQIIIFPNYRKQKDNHPDYEIFFLKPRDEYQEREQQAQQVEQGNGINDEEIDVSNLL